MIHQAVSLEIALTEMSRKSAKEKRKKMLARSNSRRHVKIPEKCSQCGNKVPLEIHHRNYDDPSDIECLCRKCHKERHTETGRDNKRRRDRRGERKIKESMFDNVQRRFAIINKMKGNRSANDWQVDESMRERKEWDRLEKGSFCVSIST